jgi:phytoene dehydrogenase-like protein
MVARTEYLIIGAGPAALRLAGLLRRGGHDYTVLERGSGPGVFPLPGVHYDTEVVQISRDAYGFTAFDHSGRTWPAQRLVMATGLRFDASVFAADCRPAMVAGRFPEQTSSFESVNVPGLYFAGLGSRALYRVLAARYHGASWPEDDEPEPDVITDAIISRLLPHPVER